MGQEGICFLLRHLLSEHQSCRRQALEFRILSPRVGARNMIMLSGVICVVPSNANVVFG